MGMGERGVGGSKCGATAAVALIYVDPTDASQTKLVTANIGDARTVLIRGGQVRTPHKHTHTHTHTHTPFPIPETRDASLISLHERCMRARVCVCVCMCVCVSPTQPIQLSVDHVPDDPEERKRIERFNPNPKMPLVR